MGRLTLSLPDPLHQALREAAARRGRSLGELVAESLTFYGIKTQQSAQELVAKARARSKLAESAATTLALAEARKRRHGR